MIFCADRTVNVDQTRKSKESINAPESNMKGRKNQIPKLRWSKSTPAP